MHRFRGRLGRMWVLPCAVLWVGLLIGCAGRPVLEPAGLQSREDVESAPEPVVLPQAHRLVAVPFFPDDTDQCGPATLASVMTFWGVPTTPQRLKQVVYLPRLRGTLPIDLLLAAQAHGLKAESYRGSLENLKSELQAGHPLVAFLNLGYALFPHGHYVVVTGYDDHRQGVYIHSSLERDLFVPYERFLRSWAKTGRWTLRVLPGEYPREAHP